MKLEWVVTHRDGEEKDMLWDRRPGGEVRLELNGPITATVEVSTEERVAELIHPGRTRMKIRASGSNGVDTRDWTLHNGLVVQPDATQLSTTIPSVDQSHRLLRIGHNRVYMKYPTDDENDFENDGYDDNRDLSEQMMWIIDKADKRLRQLISAGEISADSPTVGITQGDLEMTGNVRRWRSSDPRQTWDALVAYSKRRDGPDFALRPLDRDDGVHAALDTYYPRRGTDRSEDVIFEVGNTVSDFSWGPSVIDPELCNRVIMVGETRGAYAPVFVAGDKNSIEDLGIYETTERARDGETKIAQLEERAMGRLSKANRPSDLFEIVTPAAKGGHAQGWGRDANGNLVPLEGGEFAVPPEFGVDYDLGDIVTFRVHDDFRFHMENPEPGPGYDLLARVTAVTITEVDSSGTCVVIPELYQWEDVPDGATGYQAFIEVDDG